MKTSIMVILTVQRARGSQGYSEKILLRLVQALSCIVRDAKEDRNVSTCNSIIEYRYSL
jgi:hypothetical protein